jgi:hypothetical protein
VAALLAMSCNTFSQDLVDDFWITEHLSILHDFGELWSQNTTFRPYRRAELHRAILAQTRDSGLGWLQTDLRNEMLGYPALLPVGIDTLEVRWLNGFLFKAPIGTGKPFSKLSAAPYSNLTFWFRQRLSLQLYFRATSDPQSLPHFTGRPRDIRRLGMNAAEFDHAAISYEHDWLTLQFGRARQNWGPFESNNVALSNHSPAFDHLMAEFRYKRFRGRFFYGFLESLISDEGNVNRYLVGHGVEYSNRRNLVLSASEIIVFSGVDRPFDFSYLNPFLPALEVEQNERTNKSTGSASANAIWSVGADWMPLRGLRFSGNLTIDEFQFDQADRDQGRPDALAYRLRAAYSRKLITVPTTFFCDYEKVGSHTFRHDVAGNNFVSRGMPLGSELGSDADRWQFGSRVVFPIRLVATVVYGRQRQGEGSVLLNPYAPIDGFSQMPFPSGAVQESKFLEWQLSYVPTRTFELEMTGRLTAENGRAEANNRYLIFSLNKYLPWSFGL